MQEDSSEHVYSLDKKKGAISMEPIEIYTGKQYRILFQTTIDEKDVSKHGGNIVFEYRTTNDGEWPDSSVDKFGREDFKQRRRGVIKLHSDELSALYSHLQTMDGFLAELRKTPNAMYAVDQFASNAGIARIINSNWRMDSKLKSVLCRLLKDDSVDIDLVDRVLSDSDSASLLQELLKKQSPEKIVENLGYLKEFTRSQVKTIFAVEELKEVKRQIEQHIVSSDWNEDDWKQLFSQHPLLLSQLFVHPMIMYEKEARLGGAGINGKTGRVDFLFKNNITDNITLIEVKNSKTKLMNDTEYRDNVYSPSAEVTGAIVQVNYYRDLLLKQYMPPDEGKERHIAYNPQCVVIVGNIGDLSKEKLSSFELFRSSLKGTSIIGFDELCNRIQLIIDMIQASDVQECVTSDVNDGCSHDFPDEKPHIGVRG